jgi:hypothetical protein
MKTAYRINWLTGAAMLLALPTAYFILIAILKEWLGINGPFDALQPTLEQWGIKESIGWNINLLILFGPVIALAIAILQVLKVNIHFSKEQFDFHVAVKKSWFSLFVAAFSTGLLAILFFYLLGENCNCH